MGADDRSGDFFVKETAFGLPVGKIHKGRLYVNALNSDLDAVVVVSLDLNDLFDIEMCIKTGSVRGS